MKKMLLLFFALIVVPAWAADAPAKQPAASSAGPAAQATPAPSAQEPSAAQAAPKKAKKAKKAKAKKKAAAGAAPATALSCQAQVCNGVTGCFLSKCGAVCQPC